MKRVIVATLLACAFTPTQSAAAPREGRFGYLLPSVRNVQAVDIAQRDRYAKDVAESMATAASITAIAISAHTPSGLALQALCKSMDLAGVIDPYVGWMANEDTVSARAQAFVLDCHGNIFYQGEGSDVGAVDSKVAGESQVDARMTVATERLAQRFVQFNKANAVAWDKLRLAAPPDPLSKADALVARMVALANCSTYATTKRYVQAIAACNDADVAVNIAPSAAGLSQATACASWINTLTAYVRRSNASEDNPQLRAVDDQLRALRLNLSMHYPTVIGP